MSRPSQLHSRRQTSRTSPRASDAALSPEAQAALDQVADAYEVQWQLASIPSLEAQLQGVEEPLRTTLFEELLRIETHWRTSLSDLPQLRRTLSERFPDQRRLIDKILSAPTEPGVRQPTTPHTLGAFEDLQLIGEGGFGLVYRAVDSVHRRVVAIKTPRPEHRLTGAELTRFLGEAQAAGSLDHPHIARVWTSGVIDGLPYICYQFVTGENLKSRMGDFRTLPPLQIAAFIRKIASAVHAAHEQGIVHRDIKPSNILVDGQDEPILTDFGLARTNRGDASQSCAMRVGTLEYMSPEQAMAAPGSVDERSDVWSLGVLAYELLTGQLPFGGETDVAVCQQICECNPTRPRRLAPSIPRDLEALVLKCLEKRPDDRLESSLELVEELRRFEAGQPLHSRPISLVDQAAR
ncbi:MAG: serine/threonine protein kinase, partial [Planctomycetales bacterium]|nr:serine/threonine protein kinase [Planctomycetales bacterium]